MAPGTVEVTRRLAAAHEGKGFLAVEGVLADADVEADPARLVPAAIGRVVDRLLDGQGHPADLVDQFPEPLQVDRRVVIDLGAQEEPDLTGEGGHPAGRVLARVGIGV